MLRWTKNNKKRRRLQTHLLHPICLFALKCWACTPGFLPNTLYIIRQIQQVWAWAARAISPFKVRMWEEEVRVHQSPHTCPWCIPCPGPPGIPCWWVKPARATEKPPQDLYWSCLPLCRTVDSLLCDINQFARCLDAACSSHGRCLTSKVFPSCPKFTVQRRKSRKIKVIHHEMDLFQEAWTLQR